MKLLHLDIETFPAVGYVWGLFKQNISIDKVVDHGKTACWAAKWHNKKKIYFSGLNKDSEQEMIQKVWELLDEADVVCHYNGTKFDIPTLNKEFIKFGLPQPSSFEQLDLLSTTKNKFRLLSNKLDYVAQYLNVGKKTPHTGFSLWKECMEDDPKAWRLMEKYNKQDVVLLEEVYNALRPWIKSHPNVALYNDSVEMQCPTCGSSHLHSRGTYKTKTQVYKRFQCQECFSWSRSRYTELPKGKKEGVLKDL